MTAHGSMHVLLAPLATCHFCSNESFLICRRCTKGICVHHLVKCAHCPDYFCTTCIEPHAEEQHAESGSLLHTTPEPSVFAGGQSADIFLRFQPAVSIPGHGHVEVEAHGETAIVRVVDRNGELVKSWPNAALVRRGTEVLVILEGTAC
jgi:hypothetical protein